METQKKAEAMLEIIQRNYDKFTGTNEAELHAAEEIAVAMYTYASEQNRELREALSDLLIIYKQSIQERMEDIEVSKSYATKMAKDEIAQNYYIIAAQTALQNAKKA